MIHFYRLDTPWFCRDYVKNNFKMPLRLSFLTSRWCVLLPPGEGEPLKLTALGGYPVMVCRGRKKWAHLSVTGTRRTWQGKRVRLSRLISNVATDRVKTSVVIISHIVSTGSMHKTKIGILLFLLKSPFSNGVFVQFQHFSLFVVLFCFCFCFFLFSFFVYFFFVVIYCSFWSSFLFCFVVFLFCLCFHYYQWWVSYSASLV